MGANIALLDGLELGQLLVYDNNVMKRSTSNKDGQEATTHDMNAAKFCAWKISQRRTKRRRQCIFFIIVTVLLLYIKRINVV